MDYTTYQAEDFVLDPDFQQWVYRPTPEADHFWDAFLAAHPEKKSEIESARHILLTFRLDQHSLTETDLQEVKLAIHEKIAENDQEASPEKVLRRSAFREPKVWLKLAAVFIGFLVVSMLAVQFLAQPDEITYSTGYNETQTVLLPDSSTVIINANSTLSMVGSWEKETDRVVRLEGEAFFEVKKKPQFGNQKFIVSTRNASIEVLGTEFNVNNRRQKTQIVLSSGKVKLTNHLISEKDVLMEPGELAALSEDQPEIIQQKVETEKYTSWIDKKLMLDNTSMKTMAELLEDHYGFEVIIEDEQQAARKFSATTTLTLSDVNALLDLIEKSFDVKIIKQDRQIIIKNN